MNISELFLITRVPIGPLYAHPNYKNIANKEKRITEFFNDGVDAITEFLKQIDYDVPINVPRRYRRHMDYLKNSDY